MDVVVQIGFKQNDFTGALGRNLSKAFGRYRLVDDYWHGKALSDASWLMFRSMYTNGAWTDILLGKLPPYPPTDSVVRWTFQPIPVKLTPPPGLTVDNAVIQFGYAENGSPGNFFCTSRQERCLATSAATFPTAVTAALSCSVEQPNLVDHWTFTCCPTGPWLLPPCCQTALLSKLRAQQQRLAPCHWREVVGSRCNDEMTTVFAFVFSAGLIACFVWV